MFLQGLVPFCLTMFKVSVDWLAFMFQMPTTLAGKGPAATAGLAERASARAQAIPNEALMTATPLDVVVGKFSLVRDRARTRTAKNGCARV